MLSTLWILYNSAIAAWILTLCDAQSSCTGTTTVTRAPSGCATWTGDIVIPTAADGDINMDGLQEVDGDFKVEEVASITSLTSDSLHNITGTLSFSNVQFLSQIDFGELTSIGNLSLSGLPNLPENTLLRTLTSLSSLTIVNTGIEALEGFSLQVMDFIQILNNPYLNRINFQPYNITGSIMISANGRDLEVSMPNVQNAENMTFWNCSRISTPSLLQSYSLLVSGNFISEFNGAPLLREVDGGLSFVNNPEMTRIALPELRTVAGGFTVANNTKLEAVNELFSLEQIAGAMDFEGPLENVTFQGLTDVRGSFSINSTRDLPCDRFNDFYTDGLILGRYECTTASDSADSSTLSRGSTSNLDGSGGDTRGETNSSNVVGGDSSKQPSQGMSAGARIGVGVGVGLGVGALVGGLVGFWFHRRAKARKARAADEGGLAEKDGSEVDRGFMLGNDVQKHELEQPMEEMGTGAEAQELPAKHGFMELDCSASTKGPTGIESRHEMPADQLSLSKGEKGDTDKK